ncbi:pilus assembly protein [Kosakonia sp. MUSA4]|nr:pilus assembly protein [Kosakonia sp. MUSA4]
MPSSPETSSRMFSVRLGAPRLIYDPDSHGATLTVTNPQNYPILIQSQVLAENRKDNAPFVVTPPLMRLDGQQSSRLRIVRTGGNFSNDRETLQWLCVKGIPPKAGDQWAKKGGKGGSVSLNLQLSINNCIKLLIRPDGIKKQPDDSDSHLKWQRKGNRLVAINASPFYIDISALNINGYAIHDVKYVSPFSLREFSLPSTEIPKTVGWKIVNDYGGESQFYKVTLK